MIENMKQSEEVAKGKLQPYTHVDYVPTDKVKNAFNQYGSLGNEQFERLNRMTDNRNGLSHFVMPINRAVQVLAELQYIDAKRKREAEEARKNAG